MKLSLLFALFFLVSMVSLKAQTVPTKVETTPQGVRITTFIIEDTPPPSLEQEEARLRALLAQAEQDPNLVANGTAEKYRLALAAFLAEQANQARTDGDLD